MGSSDLKQNCIDINGKLYEIIEQLEVMKNIASKTNESKMIFKNTINKLDTILDILKRKE